jgi:hypothetical protein
MSEQEQRIVQMLYNLAQCGQQFEFKIDSVFIRGTRYGVSVYVELDRIAKGVDLETGLALFLAAVLKT